MIYPKKSKRRKRMAIPLFLLVVIIPVSCGKITSASEDLIGIWKPMDTRYSNTSFEITKNEITFLTKEGDINSFSIIKIEKEQSQTCEWMKYIIHYRNRDLHKMEFPFYFRTTDKGMIRFLNQPNLVWKKESSIKT